MSDGDDTETEALRGIESSLESLCESTDRIADTLEEMRSLMKDASRTAAIAASAAGGRAKSEVVSEVVDLDGALEDCPFNGLVCGECGEPQRTSPNGATCAKGHGGVEGFHPRDFWFDR